MYELHLHLLLVQMYLTQTLILLSRIYFTGLGKIIILIVV